MRNDFEPKHMKKAIEALAKHLMAAERHANTNEEYKKGILKNQSFWDKIVKLFRFKFLETKIKPK